jgi:hypothetical protein
MVFAAGIIVLGLGYTPALIPLPWWSAVPEPERAIFTQTWLPNALLIAFTIVGGVMLLWVDRWWRAVALLFCVAQVMIWWWLSGFFEADRSFLEFLPHKKEMIALSLGHRNIGVALAVFHRDVLVAVFYHVATLILIVSVARSLWRRWRDSFAKSEGVS